ncbi:hypothetical protein AX16_004328 [Volvariella volvacea WC 439]|nr:hypothetical protein AX16_004328 [Volvariella volvacea WC 439]
MDGSREERERVARLLISISARLRHHSKELGQTNGFIQRQLDYHLKFLPTIPHVALSETISLLIEHRRLAEASAVYERMINSGFVPSTSLDTQMTAAALSFLSLQQLDEKNEVLNRIVQDPSYTEERLINLLETCINLGQSPQAILKIVKRFLEARDGFSPGQELVTKLVVAQAKAGEYESAFNTLTEMEERLEQKGSNTPPAVDPYAALLAAIEDTEFEAKEMAERVLAMMQEQGVPPNSAVFNALISREARAGSYEQAFNVFNALLNFSNQHGLGPDVNTFRIMFSLLSKVYAKYSRGTQTRRSRIPANALSPRTLYSIMGTYFPFPRHIYTKNLNEKPRKKVANPKAPMPINVPLLNSALRAFLSTHDYPGAFLVLRAFWILDLDVNPATYSIVLKHIVNRLMVDVMGARLAGDMKWGDYFLGGDRKTPVKIDGTLTQRILDYCTAPRFQLHNGVLDYKKEDACDERTHQKYVIPTLEMMDGDEAVPLGVFMDVKPLERLLRRAILADILTSRETASVAKPGAAVSAAVAEAKKEMLPQVEENGSVNSS